MEDRPARCVSFSAVHTGSIQARWRKIKNTIQGITLSNVSIEQIIVSRVNLNR
jgi:hypothetical protein